MNNSIVRSPTVVLVNLVSPDYLERYQAPLAINTLAGYLSNRLPETSVIKIDMQKIFKSNSIINNVKDSLVQTINETVENILSYVSEGPIIVGLSIKWSTEKIAKVIIGQLSFCKDILFVIGNCEVTFNYNRILNDACFKNSVAVIGEGEEALVSIVNVATGNLRDFQNVMLYSNIPNVAVKLNGKIIMKEFARVNLEAYPSIPILSANEVYDEEYGYHAIETSRGCPWGSCTFCGIKNQFGMPSNGIKTDWKWRPFPIETVLKNIESYALQGVRIFDIKDSEFFGPVRKVGSNDPFKSTMERVMKFSNGIIQLNKKLPQRIKINHISCRVDTIFSEGEIEKNKIRLEAFKMLKDVGVESIFVGIESGSSNQLKRYCKGVTVNENENALRILTTLGFKIEPGFIMFDPIVTLDELKENIDFIERTNLYQYDSHILGSLRLQNGSPYIKLTDSKGLLLNQNDDSLTYNYNFMNDDVRMIEATFSQYESIARKLPKFLSVNLRLKGYKNDFNLLKGLIVNYGHNARLENTLAEYLIVTEQMLESAKYDIEMCVRGSENLNLSREYLEQSRNNLDIFKRTRHTKTIGQKKLRLNTLSKNNFYPMVNIKPEFTSQHHYM